MLGAGPWARLNLSLTLLNISLAFVSPGLSSGKPSFSNALVSIQSRKLFLEPFEAIPEIASSTAKSFQSFEVFIGVASNLPFFFLTRRIRISEGNSQTPMLPFVPFPLKIAFSLRYVHLNLALRQFVKILGKPANAFENKRLALVTVSKVLIFGRAIAFYSRADALAPRTRSDLAPRCRATSNQARRE